jgi:hypothetical protein
MNKFEIANTLNPVWAKIPAISDAFNMYPEAEWVWWLDVDAIIMNPNIDLYEHVLSPTALGRLLREGELIKTNGNVPIRTNRKITMSKVVL